MVLFVVDSFFIVASIVCGVLRLVHVVSFRTMRLSCFALYANGELFALLKLSSRGLVTASIMWLFLTMPLVSLQCVIVVFPGFEVIKLFSC